MRDALHTIVRNLRAAGDSNLHYLSGLELFGPEDVSMMPDMLHPNGDGYELLGNRFAEHAFGLGGLLLPGRCKSAGSDASL
eukprot:COSAG01_NODE_15253_length_1357_cov_1.613672_2_plen_81_part_00